MRPARMFGWHFVDGPVRDFDKAARADTSSSGASSMGASPRGVPAGVAVRGRVPLDALTTTPSTTIGSACATRCRRRFG
jgi:hypothetical protein